MAAVVTSPATSEANYDKFIARTDRASAAGTAWQSSQSAASTSPADPWRVPQRRLRGRHHQR